MKGEVYNQSLYIVIKAAYLYYFQDQSQKEIARLLNISVPTVSRLIRRAKEEKIIEFVICNPYLECLDLEKRLETAFGLQEVIVAPLEADAAAVDPEGVKRMVALEGARYVQRIITPQDLLGIAWGGTMYHLIHYLNPCQKTTAAFLTLHGSLSCCDYELDVRTLVSRMAMAFGGQHYSLFAEGLLSSAEGVELIRREKSTQRIFELFNGITISVSGIGSLYPDADSPLSRMEYLQPAEFAELRKLSVYGDLMLRFFDGNGRECASSLRDRTVAIDWEVYRRIPRKVVVASGAHKAHTLRAALQGGLMDVLIVDYLLAKALLNLASAPRSNTPLKR